MIMKRKTLISIASVLVGTTLFASCTDMNNKVSFKQYWYRDSGIVTLSSETLSYKVDFEAGTGLSGDNGYALSYNNGNYTTKLSLVSENGKEFYRYETELSIDVSYIYKNETFTAQDSVKTSVDFEKDVALTPIQSHKELINHSPLSTAGATVNDCYEKYDYTVDITYNGAGGTVVVDNREIDTDNTTPTAFEIEDSDDYTYLDNEQLLFALRGINPSEKSAPSLLVYAPFTKAVQSIKASFGSKVEGEKFKFATKGETEATEKTINYYPVSISIDSKSPGATQDLKIATHNVSKTNEWRNVVLEMKVPISYSLGTLTYKLVSAEFSE